MKVLVTGATGGLGKEVCHALVEGGHDVVGLDQRYEAGLPCRIEVLDLLDGPGLYRVMDGCEALVHLGNHPSLRTCHVPQRLYRENVAMDVNAFEAAVDTGVRRLVFASSIQAISGTRRGDQLDQPSHLPYLPLDGAVPAQPRNLYGASKEAGEALLRYYARIAPDIAPDLSCTAIRFPAILNDEWVERHVRERTRQPAPGAEALIDAGFAYVARSDAAALVRAVVEKQPPGYHCLMPAAADNSLGWPVAEVVDRFYPHVPQRVPVEQMTGLVDITAITTAVGWQPAQAAG